MSRDAPTCVSHGKGKAASPETELSTRIAPRGILRDHIPAKLLEVPLGVILSDIDQKIGDRPRVAGVVGHGTWSKSPTNAVDDLGGIALDCVPHDTSGHGMTTFRGSVQLMSGMAQDGPILHQCGMNRA